MVSVASADCRSAERVSVRSVSMAERDGGRSTPATRGYRGSEAERFAYARSVPLRSIKPVAKVSESGQDVLSSIQFAVQRSRINFDSGIKRFNRADTFRSANNTDQTQVLQGDTMCVDHLDGLDS